MFARVNTYIPCVWGICMWSKARFTTPSSLADYRNLRLRFPSRLFLDLARRALFTDVLDDRAIRRRAKRSAQTQLCIPLWLYPHPRTCKHGEESGWTNGRNIIRDLSRTGTAVKVVMMIVAVFNWCFVRLWIGSKGINFNKRKSFAQQLRSKDGFLPNDVASERSQQTCYLGNAMCIFFH